MIYEPREDSELILKHVPFICKGKVLDVGTGSGVLAKEASKYSDLVVALDINPEAVKHCKELNISNLICVKSDMFDFFKENNQNPKFDVILCNPPYLPRDEKEDEEHALATTGGKKGYEYVVKLLNEVNDYLKEEGSLYLVFSSLTNKEIIEKTIQNNLLSFIEVEKEKYFFEWLYFYRITKSPLRKKLENLGIKKIKKFNQGKRGLIYVGKLDGKKVSIKIKNPKSKARGRIENEARWLKLLNKHEIGAKLIYVDKEFFVYEFVDGIFIEDFVKANSKVKVKQMIDDLFNQMFVLDKLNINKEEMHHPYKHVIITDHPVLLDFERTHVSDPKNVTQLVQFITSTKFSKLLKEKGFNFNLVKLRNLAKKYKREISKTNLNKIIKEIT